MNKADDPMRATTDGKPARPGFENAAAPAPVRADGQHEAYWVLSAEERAKGWVRPLRRAYTHVGVRPKHPVRDLTPKEHERYDQFGYVQYEAYPADSDEGVGRFWTARDLKSGCGAVTTMGLALCETFSRDPKFYGATFCCGCGAHLPLDQFRWVEDGQVVGS